MPLTKEQTEKLYDLYYSFGNRLKEILSEKRITPCELADRMGVPRAYVYRFISKGGHPDMLNMIKMANALDVSIDELVGIRELDVQSLHNK